MNNRTRQKAKARRMMARAKSKWSVARKMKEALSRVSKAALSAATALVRLQHAISAIPALLQAYRHAEEIECERKKKYECP